jgi:hypothetical protein
MHVISKDILPGNAVLETNILQQPPVLITVCSGEQTQMPMGQEVIEVTPRVSHRSAIPTNKDLRIQILHPTEKIIIGSPTQIRNTCTNLIQGRCIHLGSTGIRAITEDIFSRREMKEIFRETKEIFRQYKMNKCRKPSAQETLTHAIIRGKQDNQMSTNWELP